MINRSITKSIKERCSDGEKHRKHSAQYMAKGDTNTAADMKVAKSTVEACVKWEIRAQADINRSEAMSM